MLFIPDTEGHQHRGPDVLLQGLPCLFTLQPVWSVHNRYSDMFSAVRLEFCHCPSDLLSEGIYTVHTTAGRLDSVLTHPDSLNILSEIIGLGLEIKCLK